AAPQRPRDDLAAVSRAAAAGEGPGVVLHGGHAHFPFPSPRLRDLCRAFADAGAKLVVNCHEHCPQGVEWYRGVPVVYCPGNLWFPDWNEPPAAPQDRPPLWSFGYVAKVAFDDAGPFAVDLLPVRSGPDRVEPLEGRDAEDFLAYVEAISAPLADPARLEALHDSWCSDRGREYLRLAVSALPDFVRETRHADGWERPVADVRPFLEARNVMTCESHHDLVRKYLRLIVEGRLEKAQHGAPEIAALQNPGFALPPLPPPLPRAETLDFFERNVFGRVPEPARAPALRFAEISPEVPAMDGRAVRRRVRVRFSAPGGEGSIDVLAFLPAGASSSAPVPAALFLCNRDPAENMDPDRVRRTPFWDAERIVSRGWASVAFHLGSVLPDEADGFDGGLQSLFLRPGERKAPDSWGTIAAWAWCGSRAMDWIATETRIDARRVLVAGHSRAGKAAVWCAARDERFAMAASCCSGCGGAKLNRVHLPASEHIAQLVGGFPHWFCGAFASYAGRDSALPFDQHQLLGLVAPRKLFVTSATLDPWAGQPGEFLAANTPPPRGASAAAPALPNLLRSPAPTRPSSATASHTACTAARTPFSRPIGTCGSISPNPSATAGRRKRSKPPRRSKYASKRAKRRGFPAPDFRETASFQAEF
ncbi:MAG: CapA family protein, partial [Kiritimatiellae bacterium]|nr:CapA family protein [Kiritimatiellia bacterium]